MLSQRWFEEEIVVGYEEKNKNVNWLVKGAIAAERIGWAYEELQRFTNIGSRNYGRNEKFELEG